MSPTGSLAHVGCFVFSVGVQYFPWVFSIFRGCSSPGAPTVSAPMLHIVLKVDFSQLLSTYSSIFCKKPPQKDQVASFNHCIRRKCRLIISAGPTLMIGRVYYSPATPTYIGLSNHYIYWLLLGCEVYFSKFEKKCWSTLPTLPYLYLISFKGEMFCNIRRSTATRCAPSVEPPRVSATPRTVATPPNQPAPP